MRSVVTWVYVGNRITCRSGAELGLGIERARPGWYSPDNVLFQFPGFSDNRTMNIGLAIKVAFWLVLVGMAALLAPNPAWPEWLARMILALGVAVLVTAFVVPLIRNRKNKP